MKCAENKIGPRQLTRRDKASGALGANSLGDIQGGKTGRFTHVTHGRHEHKWIPGTDIWVCTKCGTTRPKSAGMPEDARRIVDTLLEANFTMKGDYQWDDPETMPKHLEAPFGQRVRDVPALENPDLDWCGVCREFHEPPKCQYGASPPLRYEPSRTLDWHDVDWSRSNREIADEMKVSLFKVAEIRAEHEKSKAAKPAQPAQPAAPEPEGAKLIRWMNTQRKNREAREMHQRRYPQPQPIKTRPISAPADSPARAATRQAFKKADLYGESIVDKLLEHCGHCGTPTKVTLKPQNINLDRISPQEKKMGTKVEKEHVTGAKDAIAVAAAHWAEDPKYYAHGKKKGVFPELGKAKAMFMAGGSMGAMAGSAGAQM